VRDKKRQKSIKPIKFVKLKLKSLL